MTMTQTLTEMTVLSPPTVGGALTGRGTRRRSMRHGLVGGVNETITANPPSISRFSLAFTTIPGNAQARDGEPGVYIIRCRANGATYTGSSLRARTRLSLHVSLLRSGRSDAHHLQHDWNLYGEHEFEFWLCSKPADELLWWEETLTMLSDSLDDFGGYNKMLGNRLWSISSRIKNTEEKLRMKGKFSPLPGLPRKGRLINDYLRTFCQGTTPVFLAGSMPREKLEPAIKCVQLKQHLAEYVRFDPSSREAGL